ncbi:hypothetical protein P152DRAFT_456851 [Eremomyces bilateralis CBS 781.70]|uniref:EF-hand n=1 Tax=Eremomyces bilateralis CBS 781.70 TaxID=1392243 RepID=A0A6G1G9C1_9PEZI|nr:uncharacterized protein P152DRAFT_456851 [Eremomyces bilateralis CBS 781.70]KAF1814582.1 hypothetical protein P152DRAFT_456851 [Eremomyces bilateralis CBS 781.70]
MADPNSPELAHLRLTAEEKRFFAQLFNQADPDTLGIVTGDVAVKFFQRTKLASDVLGRIWQVADQENRGFLDFSGFCQSLRLIAHYQEGQLEPTTELARRPGPLAKFEGLNMPAAPTPPPPAAPIQAQSSGGPIRVPPLTSEKAMDYRALFQTTDQVNGLLGGTEARNIFEKARLPNDVLSRIWTLADTHERGALDETDFVISMHLVSSLKSRAMPALPVKLPPGLYEAASRRTPVPRQFSGQNAQRTSSPLTKYPPFAPPTAAPGEWLIDPHMKQRADELFNTMDPGRSGFLGGDVAAVYFKDSKLADEILAQIWDLSDIDHDGRLNRDEFAVALYLIRTQNQRSPPPLPAALPPNLVPPSMRNQAQIPPPPQPSSATPFDGFQPASSAPKLASEDLFGLDAFSGSAPAQTQQTTGESGTQSKTFDSDPFGSKPSSPSASQTFPSAARSQTQFKPFMPTSSFGQTLTSHSTGGSGAERPQAKSPQAVMDDLLGDNDPEVSKKLTPDTSELANMSNELRQLANKTKEVQSKKSATESDLSSTNTQKRDLQLRLSQFRSQYEQEVKVVKDLEDRLASSRNDAQKLQKEFAMLEGTYQDLQVQHRQSAEQLQSAQRENTSLRERIGQTNNEVAQLKPLIEKLRNEARHQKGMVSINKKQLATNEGEREKLKSEMNELNQAKQASRSAAADQTGSPVTSPAPSAASNQSMNPFFRKSPQQSFDKTTSPSTFTPTSPGGTAHDRFDNFFNTAFAPTGPSTSQPPQTSFASRTDSFPRSNAPNFAAAATSHQAGGSVVSSEADAPTPSTSPPLSSYQETNEPPPPPQSRQITSSELPLPSSIPRTDSFSSSVRVATPASRIGGADTPKNASSSSNVQGQEGSRGEASKPEHSGFPLPGGFPSTSSPLQADITGGSAGAFSDKSRSSARQTDRSDPFSSATRGGKVDFDAAFASFGTGSGKAPTGTSVNGASSSGGDASKKFKEEFPPIEDVGQDDDSDSNSEPAQGFEDSFTPASSQHQRKGSGLSGAGTGKSQSRPGTSATDTGDDFFKVSSQRPPVSQIPSSASTDLPTPNAQKGPPSYEQSVPARTGSNQFPPEFGGLLPSRQDPTSEPGSQATSPEKTFASPATSTSEKTAGQNLFATASGASSGPTQAPSAATLQPQPISQHRSQPSFGDDFDSGFDDLTDAKEGTDDKLDDDVDFISASRDADAFGDFNPTFDSPTASKTNTITSHQATPTGTAHGAGASTATTSDFEHMSQSFATSGSGGPSASKVSSPAIPMTSSSHDWDAIFSGLDSSNSIVDKPSNPAVENAKVGFISIEQEKDSQPPKLARALSAGSEHDDPILKRLTSMGFPRHEALATLEKYDYDLEKAAQELATSAAK